MSASVYARMVKERATVAKAFRSKGKETAQGITALAERESETIIAEAYKDLLEAEGLPTRIIPEEGLLEWSELSVFRILVPKGREHVADEIIRKV